MGRLEWILLTAVLAVATFLRADQLAWPLFWCDEAESSINALTILQHGVPTDSYLGLPVFENMLSEPWPAGTAGSEEYEFRDSSYSPRGLAVYHAWLPLYSIAGSLKLFGIEPDAADGSLVPRHSDGEILRRTIAARVPSVIYGIAFLVMLFLLGREMFGRDAGWAALLAATFAGPIIHIARQARYYSLTVALCTACCLLAWRMYRHGRWRDFILGGIAFAALFHTHILTCLIACIATGLLVPSLIQRGHFVRLCVFGGIITAAVLPWVLLTGFLDTASSVPKARDLIFWRDLLLWPMGKWPVTLVLATGMLWVMLCHMMRHRLPDRLTRPFDDARGAFTFLVAWVMVAYLAFVLLIPAASLAFQRLYLGALGPGIVFGAMLFCAWARVIGWRASGPIAIVGFACFVIFMHRQHHIWRQTLESRTSHLALIEQMRHWALEPGSRIYSNPSEHLVLSFYTGVPVQSVAPIRQSFLDHHPHDIVYLECLPLLQPVDPTWMNGVPVTGPQHATDLAQAISIAGVASYVAPRVATVQPAGNGLPDWAHNLTSFQARYTRELLNGREHPFGENPAVFRGVSMRDHTSWWQNFFFRFVDVESRSHENANYANRLRSATATVLPSMWVIYHSPSGNVASVASINKEGGE